MKEEWRPIPRNKHYEVSNLGRVRSLDKVIIAHGTPYVYRGRLLSLKPRKDGYISVGLQENGKQVKYLVHRLVAEAFLPPGKPGQTDVLHGDDDTTNNKVTNLSWGTPGENTLQMLQRGRSRELRPLTKREVRSIQKRFSKGATLMAVAEEYGVSYAIVRNIKLGKVQRYGL